jgi:hypothetical protein
VDTIALAQFLIEEEDKLGRNFETLDAIATHIANGKMRVERQQSLIASMERDGHDTTRARALLSVLSETLLTVQALHEERKDRLRSQVAPIIAPLGSIPRPGSKTEQVFATRHQVHSAPVSRRSDPLPVKNLSTTKSLKWIEAVMDHADTTKNDLAVCVVIARYTRSGDGEAAIDQERIASKSGVSKRNVVASIARLSSLGLLVVKKGHGRYANNCYRLAFPKWKKYTLSTRSTSSQSAK